jgi:acyl-[acyl-carrier-protein]-phospholipid O-acyltransferase/long-chain-fatty-acid--[acyl-carrier-protein] ligase
MDNLLITASVKRPVYFLTCRDVSYTPFFYIPLRKWIKFIPGVNKTRPRQDCIEKAKDLLRNGHILCIFAEDEKTRTGNMLSFKNELEEISRGLNIPIIPVYLDRLCNSVFSLNSNIKKAKKLRCPITIAFGQALASSAKTFEVRQAISELGADASKARIKEKELLHINFIKQNRRHFFRFCMADTTGRELTYGQTLTGALLFADYIRKNYKKENIAIMLPSSTAGCIINIAVLIAGKIPVNLNFTLHENTIDSCIKQCEIETVITSKKFIEKREMKPSGNMVFAEDIAPHFSKFKKICYYLMALVLPAKLLQLFFVQNQQKSSGDTATIIFSSGTTGEPKGIILTHANIISNIESLSQTFELGHKDGITGILPFFHSFGFTGTIWFPLLTGSRAVYHFNPLDARSIGKIVKKYKLTVLLTTPTFLLSFIKKIDKESFKSLKYVITGAEKLKERIRVAFEEKFGISAREGYGCTELSPVVSANMPDYIDQKKQIEQIGTKVGTIGQPFPGISVKIVNPDTYKILPPYREGLLLVKGPNVMKGYLNKPDLTKKVIKDGWYETGDIAFIDEDGFITITDRISRFSKIGGEMVPHIKIEEEIHKILGETEQVCVVTSVQDEKKGELLIVLYTRLNIETDKILTELKNSGLSSLWIPKKENFFEIEKIPILGTGKIDFKEIKNMAQILKEGQKKTSDL